MMLQTTVSFLARAVNPALTSIIAAVRMLMQRSKTTGDLVELLRAADRDKTIVAAHWMKIRLERVNESE